MPNHFPKDDKEYMVIVNIYNVFVALQLTTLETTNLSCHSVKGAFYHGNLLSQRSMKGVKALEEIMRKIFLPV